MNTITLSRINRVTLTPSKGWRDSASKGVIRMSYRVSGMALVNGTTRATEVVLPATKDGQLLGLGDLNGVDLIVALRPINTKFDAFRIACDDQGNTLVDADGLPILAEPGIEGFPNWAGCAYLVQVNPKLSLEVDYDLQQESKVDDTLTRAPFLTVYPTAARVVERPQTFTSAAKPMTLKCVGGCNSPVREEITEEEASL